ncbi:MAG: NYN domain-containing protein [Magnetospirillum gryphiswaldense]|nr:NYN domain-containing protein [Magnetospirillum gryphiswaldense]
MKRAIIFWDFSNFNLSMKGRLGRQADGGINQFNYRKFAERITEGMDLIRVYFACSSAPSEEGMRRVFEYIDHIPHFYLKHFERAQQQSEKQVDVYLAAQMVAQAYENSYDVAVLVSGDEDYAPAVEVAQQKGKVVVAASLSNALSGMLKRKADRVIKLTLDGGSVPNDIHTTIDLSEFIEQKVVCPS